VVIGVFGSLFSVTSTSGLDVMVVVAALLVVVALLVVGVGMEIMFSFPHEVGKLLYWLSQAVEIQL
jgi:hypothetical protein